MWRSPTSPARRENERRSVAFAEVKPRRAARGATAVALAVAVVLLMLVAAAPKAGALTPTLILGRGRIGEFQGVRGSEYIAWQQNSRRRPGHYDIFARSLDGGGTVRVNARGTNGANGSIEGDVLLYQQFEGRASDLRLFNLADRSRSSPPPEVNTSQWEYWPSISGDHLLFGRLNREGLRRIILFDTARRDATTLAKAKGGGLLLAPGQVNGDYAVWSRCSSLSRCNVVVYRISDGTKTVIPNPGGRDHAPSVTPDGVVYFARSGGACGSGVRLVRYLPGGPTTILWRLPSGDDVGTTRVYAPPGGNTTIYYDHFACGRPAGSDVWEIVEQTPIQLTVGVRGDGSGTVTSSPPGIACGSDCREIYELGTGVTLTATPRGDSVFAGWSGACSGTASTCTLTMDGPRSVTATFTTKPVLTVTTAGSGGGTVTSSPAGISCGTDCVEPYNSGTIVTLTAIPDSISTFAGWSGACTGTATTCTVTMTTSQQLTATFNKKPVLAVSRTGDGAGMGTVTSSPSGIDCGEDCDEPYDPDTVVTLTASADPPVAFVRWGGACDGIVVRTCTVVMDASKSVTAEFDDPRLGGS